MARAWRYLMSPSDMLHRPADWEEIPRTAAVRLVADVPTIVLWEDGAGRHADWLDESAFWAGAGAQPLESLRYYRYLRHVPDLPVAVLPSIEKLEVAAGDEPPVDEVKDWVEFVFEYTDRTKVSGLDYVLVHPDGHEEPGKLGNDGTISKQGVPSGVYVVKIKAVEKVAWGVTRGRCDDEVAITGRTSGLADGTSVTIRVYRELTEDDGDHLDELTAQVTGDVVEAKWKYDYSPDDRKDETGQAHFVAELRLDDQHWVKTVRPLVLELKSIAGVRWSADRAEAGAILHATIETRGYPDDTQVPIELWRHDWSGDDTLVTTIGPVALKGNKAVAAIAYASTDPADATIDEGGEYFVRVKLEDTVTRAAQSGLLWCVTMDVGDDDGGEPDDAEAA